MNLPRKFTAAWLAVLVGGAAYGGNDAAPANGPLAAADAGRGAKLIQAFGCGACHAIPGIPGANGVVGPPLDHMSQRAYLAGVLANTADNMVRWLLDPPAVDPATAMPKVDLSEADAKDMAAYLYTLR